MPQFYIFATDWRYNAEADTGNQDGSVGINNGEWGGASVSACIDLRRYIERKQCVEGAKDNISQAVKELVNGKGRDKAISKYGCIVTSDGQVLEASGDLLSMFTDLSNAVGADDLKINLYR